MKPIFDRYIATLWAAWLLFAIVSIIHPDMPRRYDSWISQNLFKPQKANFRWYYPPQWQIPCTEEKELAEWVETMRRNGGR